MCNKCSVRPWAHTMTETMKQFQFYTYLEFSRFSDYHNQSTDTGTGAMAKLPEDTLPHTYHSVRHNTKYMHTVKASPKHLHICI